MHKKYIVSLTDSERATLRALISSGKGAARRLAHARVLLKADEGLPDQAIADAVEVSRPTVERVRRRLVEEGLEAALDPRRPERVREHKIDGEAEAHLIALACSAPPAGAARWTLRLLAGKLVELEYLAAISHETVRRALKKTSWRLGASNSG
jgi:transposase